MVHKWDLTIFLFGVVVYRVETWLVDFSSKGKKFIYHFVARMELWNVNKICYINKIS
jgi:hypothetical protein